MEYDEVSGRNRDGVDFSYLNEDLAQDVSQLGLQIEREDVAELVIERR